jgi:tol-pal system protein YbgF
MGARTGFLITSAVLCLAFVSMPLYAGSRGDEALREKLARMSAQLEKLKTETIMLGEQVESLSGVINRIGGEQSTLIIQMRDNISAIGRSQSSISTNSSDALGQITAMGERMMAANERIERLSEEFVRLQKFLAETPEQPAAAQVEPGNPVQLFAAAYSDYLRGNYMLSFSEFQQFVETYRSSDLADNAQYWIGEIFLEKKRFQESLDAFERVVHLSPKGDKATVALYKRALVLDEMGRRADAVKQLQVLIKVYPKCFEANLAKQKLAQWKHPGDETNSSQVSSLTVALPNKNGKGWDLANGLTD